MKATCKPDNFWDLFFSLDRVSLCSPGCLGTYSIDQAQTHRDSTVAASRVPSVPPLLSKICLFIYWDRVSLCSFIDWLIETGFLCVALAVLEEKKKKCFREKKMAIVTRSRTRGRWDGSAGKSTDCSSKGLEFKSQQPHDGSQPSIMRSDALFWSVWRQLQCTYIW